MLRQTGGKQKAEKHHPPTPPSLPHKACPQGGITITRSQLRPGNLTILIAGYYYKKNTLPHTETACFFITKFNIIS